MFLPIELTRKAALTAINEEMYRIVAALTLNGLSARLALAAEVGETGLLVTDGTVLVKVETNTVFRGTLLPPVTRSLSKGAMEWLGFDAPASVVDRSEVFAGKFLAALDRQHPRDLFDVWRMYERQTIEPGMLSAFIVYLCGHNRPPYELLERPDRLIEADYERALVGMIRGEVPTLSKLREVGTRLRNDILTGLSGTDRTFLAGFFSCEPDWSNVAYQRARELPALVWKQRNLEIFRSNRPADFARQHGQLVNLLS